LCGALAATQTRRSEGSARNMRSGGLVQGRWDAACWHGCNSTNDTKAKTRNSAAVRASPCPMAAGASSSEENPSSRRRTSAARLFESGKQAPMCIRACPGEAGEENPSSITNPEHRRGCAEKAEAARGALQRAIASCNGNPLVDVRTGARHEDER
jgi:hypothetical protein